MHGGSALLLLSFRSRDRLVCRTVPADGDVDALGEKTPHYLYAPGAVDRMASVLPGARLIVILRDPVDRAFSHYWHQRRTNRETLDFEEAIESEADRLRQGERSFAYVERGRYLPQLQRVVGRYPRSALHVVLFEDLRDDPLATFEEVCRFLELDPSFVPSIAGQALNTFRQYRPAWLWKQMFKRNLWSRLPKRPASALGRWMVRESAYPPIDSATRRTMARMFASENAELSAWLGRELSIWTQP